MSYITTGETLVGRNPYATGSVYPMGGIVDMWKSMFGGPTAEEKAAAIATLGTPPPNSGTVTFTGGSGSQTAPKEEPSTLKKFFEGFLSPFTPQPVAPAPGVPMAVPPSPGLPGWVIPTVVVGGAAVVVLILATRKKG